MQHLNFGYLLAKSRLDNRTRRVSAIIMNLLSLAQDKAKVSSNIHNSRVSAIIMNLLSLAQDETNFTLIFITPRVSAIIMNLLSLAQDKMFLLQLNFIFASKKFP